MEIKADPRGAEWIPPITRWLRSRNGPSLLPRDHQLLRASFVIPSIHTAKEHNSNPLRDEELWASTEKSNSDRICFLFLKQCWGPFNQQRVSIYFVFFCFFFNEMARLTMGQSRLHFAINRRRRGVAAPRVHLLTSPLKMTKKKVFFIFKQRTTTRPTDGLHLLGQSDFGNFFFFLLFFFVVVQNSFSFHAACFAELDERIKRKTTKPESLFETCSNSTWFDSRN